MKNQANFSKKSNPKQVTLAVTEMVLFGSLDIWCVNFHNANQLFARIFKNYYKIDITIKVLHLVMNEYYLQKKMY